jgi:subtilisin
MTDFHLPPSWVTGELGWPTGRGVRVGIINSGFDRTLRDQRVLPGAGFVDPADDLALLHTTDDHDRLGQGTACADLVLRIAPEAQVVPLRIFGNDLETSPGVLQAALAWATERKLDVVAIGAGCQMEEVLRPLYATCERARRDGIVMVGAAHPDGGWSYPAIFENVIGVDSGRFPTPFHYRYDPVAFYEFTAAGQDQVVQWIGRRTRTVSGTMYAAANMAGIVALLRECEPGASLDQIRVMLERIANDFIA